MALRGSINKYLILSLVIAILLSCGGDEEKNSEPPLVKSSTVKKNIPAFNSDSAYAYIQSQVAFGPRVPGSEAHANCAKYLQQKLKSFGLEVVEQSAPVTTYDKKKYTLKNIIASFAPEKKERVLLCAHWDSRHIADRDVKDKEKPIDGANDGASGVGVLMEIARLLQIEKPSIGIDFIFFDLEDYGQPHNSGLPEMENSWCLGSQYWANHPHQPGYYARYGILLDMVGASDATFPIEGSSEYYAPAVVQRVWRTAAELGFSDYFINSRAGAITDDHYYINTIAAIPTIDIIHMDPHTSDFGSFHHTHNDNIKVIDKNTLNVVGQTLLNVLYTE